jgi:hypothetical protein
MAEENHLLTEGASASWHSMAIPVTGTVADNLSIVESLWKTTKPGGIISSVYIQESASQKLENIPFG